MNPQRRRALGAGAAAISGFLPIPGFVLNRNALAAPATPPFRLLVLLELRGGNDALNTVVPADDGRYFDARPRLALRDDAIVRFDGGLTLHSALAPLQALWQVGEMAVVEGVGYAQPNLSHFRSIEIWDTAADSAQFLQQGWLARAARDTSFARFGADGVVIGAADLGPLGGGARAIALADPERFARQARLAQAGGVSARGALAHVLRVESDIVRAGVELRPDVRFTTAFPRGTLGFAIEHAAAIASTRRVPVIRVTLSGFDTHQNQLNVHAQLLRQVAESVVALRSALMEIGVWQNTLVLTYSEFGRRPRENASGGTDHGTAGVSFAFGPRVARGRYGEPPNLTRLDASGNLAHTVDFRSLYATVLERWWDIDSAVVLGRKFDTLPLLR